MLQFAAHTFDASLVEILTSLMTGGCVCVPDEDERLNDLAGAIDRLRVNHAALTPSFIGFLSPAAVPGLRRLILAGEAMAPSHIATWSHITLVNGYGPAESSVAAVVNSHVGPDTEPADIGLPCGMRCWLVDPADHHRLVPVGCVGELLLEGPSLSRGYLNDAAKTEQSFIFDPAWAQPSAGRRRFYKTGDLARYNSVSGSLSYVGRKDTQVKVHGQRIELGEIEHHLAVDESVQHALILLPKSGPLENRLVAVLSLAESSNPAINGTHEKQTNSPMPSLVGDPSVTEPMLQHIRERLSARLPAYMIPSVWLCVDAVPMLTSRKMDRKAVTTWVEDVISTEECQRIIMGHNPALVAESAGDSESNPLTETETTLRDIWSVVLNLPAAQIGLDDRSFLSLGGDSISAMACASRAKKAHLGLTVQEVLRAKSLRQLAAGARRMAQSNQRSEVEREDNELLNIPFDLSPIQQYHFQVRGEAQGDQHFNQSFCLRLGRRVDETAIRDAIEALVRRHAMLRARFEPSQEDGQWRQFITSDVGSSYRFRTNTVASADQVDAGISSAQGCLNVRRGPLFAAELFAVEDGGYQILFMTAHHLVIDLVSWRVILEEMEEILENPAAAKELLAVNPSLTFWKWMELQMDDCRDQQLSQVLPSTVQVPPARFDYWGMQGLPNLYGDVVCEGFELDTDTTAALLSQCHAPFRTETVDLLLAALLWSFRSTFSDRPTPAIFNEGHGREPPSAGAEDEIDISHTIGWFTTLLPIALSSPSAFTDALIQVKDLRRRVPGNGRPYFATRFHNAQGVEKWGADHKDMEISFNFLGRYQQLERAGALFQPASHMAGEAHSGSPTADFGRAAQRFALFEISAVIVQGALRFGFAWNRGMRHQERIREWVPSCRRVLAEAAATLPSMSSRLTAGDFTLVPDLGHEDLAAFEQSKLPSLVGSGGWEGVEDIYPASPIQQGLLVSRTKDGNVYAVRRAFQVSLSDRDVDVTRLVQAWERVVQHHALLRTVFVDAISQARAGSYDQVVLKLVDIGSLLTVHECQGGEEEMRTMIQNIEPMRYQPGTPQHRLSVFYNTNAENNNNNIVYCVLEMSHAIMDGASMDILLRDLARSYAGSLDRLPKPLFSPFVAALQKRNIEADVGFWTTYLAGVEPCHFPILNDGVTVPEDKKELRSLRVGLPNLASLQAFCDAKGFTLPNAFHAAWALTLAYYTASEDVCFGYLVSGRDDALVEGSEDAVGPFINMATQRVILAGPEGSERSLLHVLEAVQKDNLDCMPYAQTSLAEVQHALKMPGGMALFNTCISYRRRLPQQSGQQSLDSESLECTDLEAIHDPTEYPISLNIETDDQGGAAIDVDYWTDAVAAMQAEHVAATFVQALSNIAEHAEMPLSQLDPVHETSKSSIWTWNANMPATTVDCVHRMVEKQAALRPQAQAVRGWDADFSYTEMDELSSRVALHLLGLGVAPEVFVPVCFDKSSWTVIAMLAVLKAGGGVVPLDATHPAEALEGKVVDSGTHIVVASETRASIFESMVPYVVAVGPQLLSQLPPASTPISIDSQVSPTDPAFVMFTSGSTGKPKGVVLCHQALVSSAFAHGSALGLGPHTRFLQFAAHTFDNSLEEMFTTLIHGGCVCVPSEADRLGDLPGAIDRLDANFMDLTPTVAALLRPQEVPKIKGMAVGGEALTQEVLDIWGGAVPVHNQYGPSECSINATHRLHLDAKGDVATIGTSVGSVSWVVDADDHNRLVPVGCVGELLIEGPILARGYLGRPVETAKVFIEMPKWAAMDPHHGERGSRRMYKTGDLVRYNSDGSLVYLGRKDTQVKLHGQRIELGEIEHHVKASLPPAAQSSVELVALGQPPQKVLAVFICLNSRSADEVAILPMSDEFAALAQTIVGAMAAKVAAYMVPNLFLPVSKMPLTSSGKLDRRRLRTAAQELSDGVVAYRLGARACNGRLPETPMEQTLRDLWASVLNVDPISISADDSFFRHGGDSVGAMRLVAAARQKGVGLTVATIFQMPKLSEMATTVTGGTHGGAKEQKDEPLPGPTEPFSLLKPSSTAMEPQKLRELVASICRVKADSVEDIYPCTPLQAGLVAASQRQPGAYVAVNSYQLPAGTDIPRFKKAWQEVVDSESILRTRVVFVEDRGFLQVVVREPISWMAVSYMADLPETHSQLPPHDGGVLSRYAIVGHQTDDNNSPLTFVWAAHHALYDGWSLSTLQDRVEARYRQPEAPPAPTPHYSRFVEYLSNIDASSSDAFWANKLSDSAPRHFPSLPHPGYRVQASSQTHRAVRFTKPKGSDVTTASFLRAAWALVLSVYSASDDVVFGEVLNGRDVPVAGIEDLVGPTFASVPRRVQMDRSWSVERALADVQAQLNDAIPHQFAGLQRIKGLSPAAAAACEFQNLLAIALADEEPAADSLWSNMTGGGNTQGADFFNYPLNVTCTVGGSDGEIEMRAFFDAGVLPPWQVARMLGQFEAALLRLAAAETQQESIGDIDLLGQDDKAVVREWNKVPGPLVERRVHDMITEQMTRQGSEATAVVGWDGTLSNGKLDTLATALARDLQMKGVGGPNGGKYVPFCFEKSTFAVVAMLAVLKAGAAFVPLDPSHPVARLKEIVDDCEAGVILCSPKYLELCSQLVDTVVGVDGGMLRNLEGMDESDTTGLFTLPLIPER